MSGEISTADLVQEWLRLDENPTTRQEIIDLQEAGDDAELEKRLRDRIVFGTAGLRSKMEAGFSRMNDLTVLQASQGLAQYLLNQKKPHDETTIVIGHDHRHNSARFAQITAAAFLLKGIKVYYLGPDTVATPVVPFAVDHYSASGGIMITASHNPAADNGYKVYWGNGCQIIPPHDSGIQAAILGNLEPVEGVWNPESVIAKAVKTGALLYKKAEISKIYIEAITTQLVKTPVDGGFSSGEKLKMVYTPMHGVGLEFVQKLETSLGVDLVVPGEQAQPDPDFPTVKFPNPEEKGAADLAMATADAHGLDLVLMNDPDADRFSAAVKHGGLWRQLTGNELGFLFASYVVESAGSLDNVYLLNSTVSSQMIKSMAAKLGAHYEDTLTGFKWIGNKAIDLEKSGYSVPFGYEEAIGFMFGVVHDKDGISALAVFVQMYREWLRQGTSPVDKLQEGFRKFGYFKEFNGYYVVPDLLTTPNIFNGVIRKYARAGERYPLSIGDYKVVAYRDLTIGFDSTTPDNRPALPVDPTSQMVTVELEPVHAKSALDHVRFTARGSGTEPKLKIYIEGTSDSEAQALALARDVWSVLRDQWFKPDHFHLLEVC